MKFKFIGKKTLIVDTLTPHKVYNIIQFEHFKTYVCVYIIDDRKEVICVPYTNMGTFNENWKVMNCD